MTGSSSKDSIMVMKFGGTSVQTEESRKHVINHIRRNVESGKKVVAVVSAMGRKGAALNTVQIARELINRDLIKVK